MDNQPNVNDLAELVGDEQKPTEVVDTVDDAPVYNLILGLRRIKAGPFAGLWELTELTGEVSVKRVVMDASTRASVIALATREIGKAV
jgi:hypothetical protein